MRNCTSISIILDRSGSMSSIQDDTIGGINTFLSEQRNIPGECEVSLYQFDNEYNIVYQNMPVNSTPNLSRETFIPRGSTSLLDAIGRTIEEKGQYFANLPESQRPDRILVVIMTDGQENSSRNYNFQQIQTMISRQESQYNWSFVFLGANQDAIASASHLGISAGKSLTYGANAVGVQNTNKVMSDYTSKFRCSASPSESRTIEFTEQDRVDALGTN